MKKTLLTLLLLFMTMALWAQIPPKLVVWQANGQKAYYELSEEPIITFVDDKFVIKTKTTTVDFLRKNIVRYTYEGIKTGVELDQNCMLIRQEGNTLSLAHLPKGTPVQLFNSNGVLLENRISDGQEPVCISVEMRSPGVYIVKTGSQTIKLMRR